MQLDKPVDVHVRRMRGHERGRPYRYPRPKAVHMWRLLDNGG